MTLETNLDQSPYYDDFDETKNFHRILFRPARAVQARELTQMQTILQNQIERFANEVLVDGTVVDGVGLHTETISYVKLRDKDANNRVILLGDFYDGSSIANVVISGATSGVTAKLVDIKEGSEAAAPDNLSIFVHYLNSGTSGVNKAFSNNEVLLVRHASNNSFVVAANTIATAATGLGFRAAVTTGIVYHKGHFVRVPAQTVIVEKYSIYPNKKIGFETVEYLINSNQDSSLLENASGSTNINAPGADRLKLLPTLTARTTGQANTTTFFSIATIENGVVIQKNNKTIYSDLGDYISNRMYETNGNFTIEPFNVRIREHLKTANNLGVYTSTGLGDNTKLIAEIERGVGYVGGQRIETVKSIYRNVDKATDFETKDAVVIGQAFGQYVNVEQVVGNWDMQGLRQVSLRNAAQLAISSRTLGAQAAVGSEIGTARVRGIQYESGTMGTSKGRYRIYLFDIQMNSGSSFADVRGLFVSNATHNSLADIILEASGIAKIQEPSLGLMVFPFSQRGTKTLKDSDNNVDTQFVFRTEKTVNFTTAATATVTSNTAHAGGIESMNDTGSPLTSTDERNIIVVAKAAVDTTPMTGYVSSFTGNTFTGTGTAWNTAYRAGEFIKVTDGANTLIGRIVTAGATSIVVANAIGYTRSGVTLPHRKHFPAGYVFDMSANGTSTSTSSQHVIDLEQANLASTFSASVYFDVLRSAAVPTAKTVNKNKYIKINTGSHSASKIGPWPIGVSDVYKLVTVYKGSNTGVTTASTDVTSEFELDSGMRDSFYDTACLKQKATSTLNLTNCGLLVKFNYFTRNHSAGTGFLSVDSYPIDDANTANTSAITTQEIPLYRTSGGTYIDLRDSIDFRPMKANTVAVGATHGAAPTNPTTATTYTIDADGAHVPTPDENFQADIQFYLPRRDRIVLTKDGNVEVVKGVGSFVPKTPNEPAVSMTLATLKIPVYPSLSSHVAKQYGREDYAVTLTAENNRRYTMRDLRAVENRVRNLEYYSSLNSLEASAKNKQLFNPDGFDRYKNGFLVDTFAGHNIGDTSKSGYRAAIDVNRGVMRPTFIRENIKLDKDVTFTSSNITQKGNLITLLYSHVLEDSQPRASKLRNPAQELSFNWIGEVILNPSMDNTGDIVTIPDIQLDYSGLNGAANNLRGLHVEEQFVWGDWETTNFTYTDVTHSAGEYLGGGVHTNNISAIEQETQIRSGFKTSYAVGQEVVTLEEARTDISVRDYMRSRVINFTGHRMRPLTRVYPFFDEEKVSAYCTPTNSSFVATGIAGANLVTNSAGTVYGQFRIPNDDSLKFRSGTKRFELKDVSDSGYIQTSLVTTSAHGDYTSSGIDVVHRGAVRAITTTQTAVVESIVESRGLPPRVIQTNQIWGPGIPENTVIVGGQQVTVGDVQQIGSDDYDFTLPGGYRFCASTAKDPLSQTFVVTVPEETSGIFLTKVGLYFGKKSSTYPFTVQIREVENGFPTRTILPYASKTLVPGSISANITSASTETQFEFDSPVFLKNGAEYCFVMIPGGNSDEYGVWVGELGATDVDSSELIDKQPAAGVLFSSANDRTWSPIQSEDVKYNLYRAEFTANTGIVYIENNNMDFLYFDNRADSFVVGEKVIAESVMTFANNRTISVGNVIKSRHAHTTPTGTGSSNFANGTVRQIVTATSGSVTIKIDNFGSFPTSAASNTNNLYIGSNWVGNTSAFTANTAQGRVEFIDVNTGKLNLYNSAGGFANGYIRGQSSGASARVTSSHNATMNAFVPKIPEINFAKTTSGWSVRTATGGAIQSGFTPISLGTENVFLNNEKTLYGKSQETSLSAVNGSKKTLVLKGTFTSTDSRLSPVIDVSRATAYVLENVINNSIVDEHKEVGDAYVRYISTPIELADGQEAEDLIVYLTAYKPPGSEISVYARVKGPEDAESFDTKDYTPLTQITSATLFSDSVNTNDAKEYEYTFSANTYNFLASANNHAYLNTSNNNVIAYRAADGSQHHGYKSFAIKIVLTSTGTNIVPVVEDMRAIALQK